MTSPNWAAIAGQVIEAGAPTLGGLLAGPAGGVVGNLVGSLIGQALGVAPTPEAIGQAIQSDPSGAAAKIQAVEQAHGQTMSALEAEVADLASAREQTVDLAKSGSAISFGAPIVSAVTTLGFIAVAVYATVHGVADSQATQLVVGALVAGFSQVIGYWLGSSFGSRSKDDAIAAAVVHLTRK